MIDYLRIYCEQLMRVNQPENWVGTIFIWNQQLPMDRHIKELTDRTVLPFGVLIA